MALVLIPISQGTAVEERNSKGTNRRGGGAHMFHENQVVSGDNYICN